MLEGAIVFACLCVWALCWNRRQPADWLLLAVANGDEDIKIADGHFSTKPSAEDAAELAAQDFLRQKQSGNIDHARDLGERFSRMLLDVGKGPLAGELDGKPEKVISQMYLLASYAVTRAISDFSPNSILAQTTLNVFYSKIEKEKPEIHKYLSDMTAFSLYILCERSRTRSDSEIGEIFAQLCDQDQDETFVDYGNMLYKRMYDAVLEEIQKVPYTETESTL